MAKKITKKCSKCGEVKPATQFSKQSKSKDGLQSYCTSCKKLTHDPYMRGDKNGIIYRIVNPLGETYIGSTKKKAHLRWNGHKSDYNFATQTGYKLFPKLHKSFDKWGINAHIFEEVMDCGNISREELRDIESRMIIALKQNGKSLNVNN